MPKVNGLTRKQKIFVKHLIDNPKQSATEAAAKTYDVLNRDTARSIAAENLAKPSIISELSKYNNMVETALITTVDDWKQSPSHKERAVAMDVGKYIHDKIHGKATQRTEVETKSVQININLSE